jgi:hypothetical protein
VIISHNRIGFTSNLRPHYGSPHWLPAQPDDRISDEIFRHGADGGPVSGRIKGEHGGDALTVERLDQDVEELTRVTVAVARQPREAVNEHAPRAQLRRLGEEQALGFLDLLLEDATRRGDDLHAALLQEPYRYPRGETPALRRCVRVREFPR